jgi:AcrR family transcriptional regulator
MEIKQRIREKATELFLRYGIRSISMDDIATQLGMSKKTIYQSFSDKDELVDDVVDAEIRNMQEECLLTQGQSTNAVEEIFLTMEMVQEQFRNMNPVLIYDLQKFHIRSYQRFMDHKNRFLLEIIKANLGKGIREGLYRPDLNVDVLSKFRLESMMIPFNMDLFPPSKYNLADVTQVIMEHFLFGVATEEGFRLILKYQKEQYKTRVV